jgi:hypothetical protein
MEQSGRNQWRPMANGAAAKPAQKGGKRCRELPGLATEAHGKEGVDGSSPSEGLHKKPANKHS